MSSPSLNRFFKEKIIVWAFSAFSGYCKIREDLFTTLLLGHLPGPASPAVRCGGGPPGDRGYRRAVPGYCEEDEGEIIRRLQDDEARKL